MAEVLCYYRAHNNTTRAYKSRKAEMLRFNEYFRSIRVALAIVKSKRDSYKFKNENITWIYNEFRLKKKTFGIYYYFPPIPFNFLIHYFILLVMR
jgi:hypothetical protein